MRRYTLKYEFSTDGLTWIDFTDAVDSMQTKLNYSLCTQGFLSAKDSVNFTLPATSLPVKNQLINALMGQGDIHFRMYIPTPVPVMWDGENVQWNGEDVLWKGVAIGFTGFIDRSSVDLRSYPLPTALTLTAYDVSVQHLDDKIDHEIVLENKKISEIVAALLLDAGYTVYDVSGIDVADDRVLDAFVAEADKSKTYRQYIDTLLFEAPGYVLDFTPSGSARIVRIPWDDAVSPIRTIDNPMNANGIHIKSAYLKEDGVKVKWSSLKWGEHMPLWRDSIDAQWDADYGDFVGEWIKMNRYWPENGELVPAFMEFSTEWLDTPYLRKDTRLQNEDLSIIMAKQGTVSASIHADRGGKPYEFPIPEGYPVPLDFQTDPYNFTANPLAWAKKAWYLLYNPQWSPVIAQPSDNPASEGWWYLNGGVYTKATETAPVTGRQYYIGATYTAVTPQGTENPAYEGWFVFDGTNYVMTTDVQVQPGTTYYEAKDGEVNLMSFVIYGDVLYRDKINTLQNDNTKNPKEYTSEYIYDDAHAKAFMNFYWHFLNTSRFSMSWAEPYKDDPLGSVVEITQKGMVYSQDAVIVAKSIQFVNDNTPIVSYSAVGVAVPTLENGVAYSITPQGSANNITPEEMDDKRDTEELKQEVEDIQVNVWNFNLSTNSYKINKRFTAESPQGITATATVEGFLVTPSWAVIDLKTGNTIASGSGNTFTFSVAWDNAYTNGLKVQMTGTGMNTIEKTLSAVDETEYDHDWGLWIPYAEGGINFPAPDHYTDASGILCAPVDGDYFVAQKSYFYSGASVSTPTSNPKAEGFYERINGYLPGIYVATEDTSIVSGKIYYKTGGTSVLFKEGVPYIYDNNTWHNEMTANAANSGRLMRCLGNVLSDPNVQPYTAAIYAWFENLVAKNAVLENLVAMFLQVGHGDGTAGSGFRFRALNDDGHGSPVFDVYYGDKKVFQVDVTSGDILFGGGLIYHASTDTIESSSALFNGITINNTNGGEANFGSALFKQENPTTVSLTISSSTEQGKTIYDWILSTFGITGPSGTTSGWYTEYFPCTVASNANVKFMRAYRYWVNAFGLPNLYAAYFYDSNKQEITALRAERYLTTHTDKNPFSIGDIISTQKGGNVMFLYGLPMSAPAEVGRVWNHNGVLEIVT